MESNTTPGTESETQSSGDVLIVASKLKNYIRAQSGMNTSGGVAQVLSDRVRRLCDEAIENAKREGRKTVMDRDFP
jgi:histone H3/H4